MREERKERGEERRGEGRKEGGRKERERRGRKRGRKERGRRGRKEGGRREKVKAEKGGKEEEREIKENTTLLCCKNGQLMYHICNVILLPSSSIVLVRKSIPGEAEGRKRGTKTEECGSNESRWAENRITTNIPLIIRTK